MPGIPQHSPRMKRILYLIPALLLGAGQAAAQPKANFEVLHKELGSILWNLPQTTSFKVTNSGDTTLVISNVYPSCGCTTANWTRTPIAPGEAGTIDVTYDAALLGHFTKDIIVETNATAEPTVLTFSGDVVLEKKENTSDFPCHIGEIYLDTDNLEFDDVRRGDTPTLTLRLFNAGRKSYTPELMHLPQYLSVAAEPATIRPGRTGKLNITLDSEKLRNYGLTQTDIYLSRFPGDRVNAGNQIYVSATLLPELDYSPAERANAPHAQLDSTTIHLGPFGKKDKLKTELVLTNTGKSPLNIQTLQVYNPGLSVRFGRRTLKPGQSDKLKITVSARGLQERRRRRVLLITNDPDQPKIVIDLIIKK